MIGPSSAAVVTARELSALGVGTTTDVPGGEPGGVGNGLVDWQDAMTRLSAISPEFRRTRFIVAQRAGLSCESALTSNADGATPSVFAIKPRAPVTTPRCIRDEHMDDRQLSYPDVERSPSERRDHVIHGALTVVDPAATLANPVLELLHRTAFGPDPSTTHVLSQRREMCVG
jgi:hypothetical protein